MRGQTAHTGNYIVNYAKIFFLFFKELTARHHRPDGRNGVLLKKEPDPEGTGLMGTDRR